MIKKIFFIGLGILILTAAIVLLRAAIVKNGNAARSENSPILSVNRDEERVLLKKAEKLAGEGELIGAKELYQKIIERFPSSNNMPKVQEALDNLNIAIIFSPIATQDSYVYEVEKGDALVKLAKRFNTTADLIAKANGLKDLNIRVGQKLKITKAKFSIVVDKSQNILTLKSGDDVVKTYKVSTGKNSSTPVGTFKITNRIIDPAWPSPAGGLIQPGDPKNVLGSRWMGISKAGYGIHGTTQPESIGKSVTEGCIRMKNSDVEELFVIVPEGTEVVIVD